MNTVPHINSIRTVVLYFLAVLFCYLYTESAISGSANDEERITEIYVTLFCNGPGC